MATNATTEAPKDAQSLTQTNDGHIDLDKPIVILSRNIQIRMMQHSDAPILAKYANNKKVAQNMRSTWPDPYTLDSAHGFIAMIRDQSKWKGRAIGRPSSTIPKQGIRDDSVIDEYKQKLPWAWVITFNDQPIGSLGVKFSDEVLDRSASFGYWIAEDFWGQGIMTETVTGFVQWFWETYPFMVRLSADRYGWNPASGRVLEKAGFVFEGCLSANACRYGSITDEFVYAIVRKGIVVSNTAPF